MALLLIGLVLFLGVHSIRIFAPGLRQRLIGSLGERRYRVIYSIASIVTLAILVWGYAVARADSPILYVPPRWLAHLTLLLMIPASILVVASALPPARIKLAVRHPLLIAIKTWALAHLLANGDLASVVLFVAFLAWAVADRIVIGKQPIPRPKGRPTNFIDASAVVGGLVLYVLFVWQLHEWLIGVSPVA